MSGRVEELEREAAELRRENGWLKEIVMLKSKRFGAGSSTTDQAATTPSEEPRREDDLDNEGSSGGNDNSTSAPDASGKGKGREVS